MNIITNFTSKYLPDQYSKYAEERFYYKKQPILSFPFEIQNLPPDSQYLCFSFIDFDAVPVCGFPWIHWLVANVPAKMLKIPENFSRDITLQKVQGANSFSSFFVGETDTSIIHRYTGPTPPDADHDYTLTVYALNAAAEVREGFCLNELYKQMVGKLLGEATILIKARV